MGFWIGIRKAVFKGELNKKQKEMDVKIVILMLAHDGVKNMCWSAWMEEAQEVAMVCYIQDEEQRQSMPTSKFENVVLASQECLDMPSSWAHPDTTLVSIRLLSEAMELFPDAAHFILVSGRCVPIVPPASILSWSDSNIENSAFYIGGGQCFNIVEGMFYWTQELTWEPTEQPRGTRLRYTNGPNIGNSYRSPIQTHDQRWILNRGHAALISQFPTDSLIRLDISFSNPRLYNFHEGQRRDVVICSDEYWMLLVLRLQGVEDDFILHQVVCPQIFENADEDSSPIIWRGLDEPKYYSVLNPALPSQNMPAVMTLRQAIQGSILAHLQVPNSCLFFFRKVEFQLDDQIFTPWNCEVTQSPQLSHIKLLDHSEAQRLSSAQYYSSFVTGEVVRKATNRLMHAYSNLQAQALTLPMVRRKKDRDRIRKKKQREMNTRKSM